MDKINLILNLWLLLIIITSWFLFSIIKKYYQNRPMLQKTLIDSLYCDLSQNFKLLNLFFCGGWILFVNGVFSLDDVWAPLMAELMVWGGKYQSIAL